MSFKKILAVVMACAIAIGAFAASALTLDVAEVANETNDEVAVLAATTLPAAVDGVVTLTEDVVLAETLVINSDVTIDLAGYKITSADASGEEAIVSTLIYVSNGATLTVKDNVGGGKVVGGTRTNIKAYSGVYYTIKVENAKLVVDGAVIEGSKGINTRYGGTAIYASNSDVVIANAVIKGGDVEKNGITASNYENYYVKYQGFSGDAIYAAYSTVKISKSEIYGGNGVADDDTEVSYISGGANQADGGIAIYATRETTNIEISESVVKGGDSELLNAANAVYLSNDANVAITDSTVTGGSCLVKNGHGIAGAGISTSHDSSEVTVIGSTVTGGSTDDSWIGSAIEITNQSNGAIIKIEDSTLATGSGEGSGADAYAIETENAIGTETVELKNVTLKAVEGKTGVISESVGTVTAEGTLNTEGGDLGAVVVETTTGVAVNGDTNVAKKIVARVNGKGFETLGEALTAAEAVIAGGETTATVKLVSDVAFGNRATDIETTVDGIVFDLNGYTMTLGGDHVYTKDTTFKNGTIAITDEEARTGVFWMWNHDNTLTFENVVIQNAGDSINAGGIFTAAPDSTGDFVFNNVVINLKNNTFNPASGGNLFYFQNGTSNVKMVETTITIDSFARGLQFGTYDIDDSEITMTNMNGNAIRRADAVITNSTFIAENTENGMKLDSDNDVVIDGDSYVRFLGATDYDLVVNANSTVAVKDDAVLYADKGNIADASTVTGNAVVLADIIKVDFEQVDGDAEGYDLYNINLVGANGEVINRLNSADLTFKFVATPATGAAMDYEIIAVEKITVTPDTTTPNENRFMFNFKGKDLDVIEGADTAKVITIAQVKVTGYGKYEFSVDTSVEANKNNVVHATTISDNIVDTFVPGGATGKGTLDLSASVGKNIEVPTRTLTVNVTFPNSVEKNDALYQDMKVEITGNIEGVHQTVTHKLGEDEVAMLNDGYVVTEARLVLNETYNIVVTGAGYRTARYTVTMTDSKTVNFWNNVKDNDTVVEEGKYSEKLNFLAGDIVGDNNINIYDLSAVVSYFATSITDEADYETYVKYDLNRDHVIDSKDVAYVLVSWGK